MSLTFESWYVRTVKDMQEYHKKTDSLSNDISAWYSTSNQSFATRIYGSRYENIGNVVSVVVDDNILYVGVRGAKFVDARLKPKTSQFVVANTEDTVEHLKVEYVRTLDPVHYPDGTNLYLYVYSIVDVIDRRSK